MVSFSVQCDAAFIAERVMEMDAEETAREAQDIAGSLPHLLEPVAKCLATRSAPQLDDFLDFGGLR